MIQIRVFSPTDVPSVMKVVERSLGEHYPPSLYLTVHNLWREGFLLVLGDGEVVGFIATVPSGPKMARILMLAILPEWRKKSLGRKLMKELYSICIAKGLDSIVLEVRKSNKDAISFYEQQGFSVCGEVKSFYSNGEDAYKMIRVLQT